MCVSAGRKTCFFYLNEDKGSVKGHFTIKHENSPEDHVLQVERVLDYTRRGHSDPQDVLLRRQIRRISDSVQVVQVAGGEDESGFIGVK